MLTPSLDFLSVSSLHDDRVNALLQLLVIPSLSISLRLSMSVKLSFRVIRIPSMVDSNELYLTRSCPVCSTPVLDSDILAVNPRDCVVRSHPKLMSKYATDFSYAGVLTC